MATLQNSIELRDGVSPVLEAIQRAAENTSAAIIALEQRAKDLNASLIGAFESAKNLVTSLSGIHDITIRTNEKPPPKRQQDGLKPTQEKLIGHVQSLKLPSRNVNLEANITKLKLANRKVNLVGDVTRLTYPKKIELAGTLTKLTNPFKKIDFKGNVTKPTFLPQKVDLVGNVTKFIFPTKKVDFKGNVTKFTFPNRKVDLIGNVKKLKMPDNRVQFIGDVTKFKFPTKEVSLVGKVTKLDIPVKEINLKGNVKTKIQKESIDITANVTRVMGLPKTIYARVKIDDYTPKQIELSAIVKRISVPAQQIDMTANIKKVIPPSKPVKLDAEISYVKMAADIKPVAIRAKVTQVVFPRQKTIEVKAKVVDFKLPVVEATVKRIIFPNIKPLKVPVEATSITIRPIKIPAKVQWLERPEIKTPVFLKGVINQIRIQSGVIPKINVPVNLKVPRLPPLQAIVKKIILPKKKPVIDVIARIKEVIKKGKLNLSDRTFNATLKVNRVDLSAIRQPIVLRGVIRVTDPPNVPPARQSRNSFGFWDLTGANILADLITRMLGDLTQIPGKILKQADAYTGIMARLGMVTKSVEELNELNEAVYQSALRSRGGYLNMADAVSKIALTASQVFKSAQDVVPFMERIQKLFVIGGTDVIHQRQALLQLTQALGSGRFMGDEFRSIAESAPLIPKLIADYMGVTRGELKALSSQGKITAEVMRNAIMAAADDIDKRFDKIPMRWADITQNFSTEAQKAFAGVNEQIGKILNSPAVLKGLRAITSGLKSVANEILYVMKTMEAWIGEASTLGNRITPPIRAMIGILGAVSIAYLLVKANALAAAIMTAYHTASMVASAIAAGGLSAALANVQGALTLLGLYNPFTAMLVAIGIVIGFLTWLYSSLVGVQGEMQTVSQALVTAIGTVAETIFFTISYLGMAAIALAILTGAAIALIPVLWVAAVALAALRAGAVMSTIATYTLAAANAILNAVLTMNPIMLVVGVIMILIGALTAWGVATHGLTETWIAGMGAIGDAADAVCNFVIERINAMIRAWNEAASWLSSASKGLIDLEMKEEITYNPSRFGDAARNFATGTANKIKELTTFDFNPEEIMGKYKNLGLTPPSVPSYDELSPAGGLDGKGDKLGRIADNTGKMADGMDEITEELKYYRDFAEEKAIQNYTTQTVTLDLGGIHQSISSDTDIDGIVEEIIGKIEEGISSGAEALHA